MGLHETWYEDQSFGPAAIPHSQFPVISISNMVDARICEVGRRRREFGFENTHRYRKIQPIVFVRTQGKAL
jgi:hypothetical protein